MRTQPALRVAHHVLITSLLLFVWTPTKGFQQELSRAKGASTLPDSAPASLVLKIREAAHTLTGSPGDYDRLVELIGDARVVMLGEATHGTHEFYRERARITRRLI